MVTFSIVGVIQSIDKQLYCYDKTFKTYDEALVFDDNTLKMIVVLYGKLNSGRKVYKFIDMNALLNVYLTGGEYASFTVNSWEELETFLSILYNEDVETFTKYQTFSPVPRVQHYKRDGVVYTRVTPFKTNMKEFVDIISYGYTDLISGSYVNKDAPLLRNLSHRRVSMPDLVFSKTSDDVTFDLANTMVSVDGIVCYPLYSKETDELYACNGARFLKNTTDSNSMNILLMNFGKLGTLHHYKLSDCKQELIIRSGEKVWMYYDPLHESGVRLDPSVEYWQDAEFTLKFKLPLGAPKGKIVLSLAGRMFFQGLDDITISTESGYTTIEFHITSSILENIIASNLQHQNLFFNKSNLFRVVLSYIFCNIFADQAYQYDMGTSEWLAIQFHADQVIPFVTIIESDTDYALDKIEGLTTYQYGKIIFPSAAKGLLMNKDTREFIDYTKLDYKDQTLVTFTPQNPLFIEKREGTNTNSDPLISLETTYDDAIANAPECTDIFYSIHEKRFKIKTYVYTNLEGEKTKCVTMIAQSITLPYETDTAGAYKTYTWDTSFGTPEYNANTKCWSTKDSTGLVNYESETTTGNYDEVVWYKLEDYTKVGWFNLADGTTIVSDGVRTDRMAWQTNPIAFSDMYNQFQIGEYIKDPRHYVLVDINIMTEDGSSDLLEYEEDPSQQPDPNDDTSNPAIPVLTSEYERVKDTLKIGDGTAPDPITHIKVSPTIQDEQASTTIIKVTNAGNIKIDGVYPYAMYDGNYLLTQEGTVGVERIWASQTVTGVVIKYIPGEDSESGQWVIVKNDTIIFHTDHADTGSAPYNSTLTWRIY